MIKGVSVKNMESITKKRWRLGLIVTFFTTFFASVGSIGIGLDIKQWLAVTTGFLGRELYKFLKDHPIESISDLDTSPAQFVKTTVTVDTKTTDQKPIEVKTNTEKKRE